MSKLPRNPFRVGFTLLSIAADPRDN